MKKTPIILALFVALSGLSFAQESRPLWPEGKAPYALPVDAETGSPSLQLYPTQGQDGHTGAAVVICPGGGYGNLAKDHEGNQPAMWFNQQGVSAFVLHYRLGSQGHHYPTELADVQRAIRWVRAYAGDYGIDPNRIAVMGFSAGGHLASMAATLFDENAYDPTDEIDTVSARPDFAILCYPVISLDRAVTHGGSRKNLLGPEREGDEEWAKKLSSDLNVTERTPPTFLFQTNADTAVPAENAVRFYLALRHKKVPAEMHIYQNGPHGVGLYLGDPILGTWSGHLSDWLRTNFFFAPPQARAAVSGEVLLDGEPVSWGSITFAPENPNLPTTTVRVRNGKFSAKAEDGPIAGKAALRFEGSIWEATGKPEDKETARLTKLAPGDASDLTLEVADQSAPLRFEFRSR
ncbi:MAG TPA: alpha/beta hydrolase [Bacteroidia bacterium]|nr:alpha/beta hydrolase [Bacteroidia bacterium]